MRFAAATGCWCSSRDSSTPAAGACASRRATRPAISRRRQVLGERNLLRRGTRAARLPGAPGLPVAAGVLAGAAEREQHEPLVPGVDELPSHVRGNAREPVAPELVRLALDHERELALEHQVDLLLALVRVDAP